MGRTTPIQHQAWHTRDSSALLYGVEEETSQQLLVAGYNGTTTQQDLTL